MATLDEIFEDIARRIVFLENQMTEILGAIEFDGYDLGIGDSLPSTDLNPNRLFVLTTDQTGGEGGTLYRYNSGVGAWQRIS